MWPLDLECGADGMSHKGATHTEPSRGLPVLCRRGVGVSGTQAHSQLLQERIKKKRKENLSCAPFLLLHRAKDKWKQCSNEIDVLYSRESLPGGLTGSRALF